MAEILDQGYVDIKDTTAAGASPPAFVPGVPVSLTVTQSGGVTTDNIAVPAGAFSGSPTSLSVFVGGTPGGESFGAAVGTLNAASGPIPINRTSGNLSAGQYYVVRATNATGTSGNSNEVASTPPAVTAINGSGGILTPAFTPGTNPVGTFLYWLSPTSGGEATSGAATYTANASPFSYTLPVGYSGFVKTRAVGTGGLQSPVSAEAVATGAPVTLSISPAGPVTVPFGGTQQFTATTNDPLGVTWSVVGGGTINASGLFTAPSSGASGTVTATSKTTTSVTASATVNFTAAAATAITLNGASTATVGAAYTLTVAANGSLAVSTVVTLTDTLGNSLGSVTLSAGASPSNTATLNFTNSGSDTITGSGGGLTGTLPVTVNSAAVVAPPAPSLTGSLAGSTATLTATDSSGRATSFQLYANGVAKGAPVSGTGSVTFPGDSSEAAGATVNFTATAINSAGASAQSAAYPLTFPAAAPAATGLGSSVSSSSVITGGQVTLTVGLIPVNGTLASPKLVTPTDGGAGGSFSPATANIGTGQTLTFTYTAGVTAGTPNLSAGAPGLTSAPNQAVTVISATQDQATALALLGALQAVHLVPSSLVPIALPGTSDILAALQKEHLLTLAVTDPVAGVRAAHLVPDGILHAYGVI